MAQEGELHDPRCRPVIPWFGSEYYPQFNGNIELEILAIEKRVWLAATEAPYYYRVEILPDPTKEGDKNVCKTLRTDQDVMCIMRPDHDSPHMPMSMRYRYEFIQDGILKPWEHLVITAMRQNEQVARVLREIPGSTPIILETG